LPKLKEYGPLVLRLILGAIFIVHGWGKVSGMFGYFVHGTDWSFVNLVEFMPVFPAIIWAILASLGEFLGGIFVFLGYQARWAAAIIAVVMLAAIFGVHVPRGFDPEAAATLFGEIEYPLALLSMSISIVLTGSGRFSIRIQK